MKTLTVILKGVCFTIFAIIAFALFLASMLSAFVFTKSTL